MKIVVFTYPNYSHNTGILALLKELINQGNDIYCFGKDAFEEIYYNTNINFIKYPNTVESYFGNINKAYIDDLNKPSDNDIIESLIYRGIFNTNFALKVSKNYKDLLIDKVKEINPDIILRDSCALFGKMIGEHLNIKVLGYITNLVITKDYILKNIQKNFSDAMGRDLSFLSQVELAHIFSRLECGIEDLCEKYSISKIPSLFTLDPGEEFNIIFSCKKLQPELHSKNFYKYKIVSPSLFSDLKNNSLLGNKKTKNVIYISTGSIFCADIKFYNTIIKAFKNSNYEIIISFPLADKEFMKFNLPENVKIFKFVNQKEILSKSALFITHGGYNSIYESIYYDVPMMVYPLSNDQHINASIVDNLNIGVDLRKYKFDFKTIQNLSNNLINNEKIHTNLKVLRNDFSNTMSLKNIAKLITTNNINTETYNYNIN